MSRFIFSIIPDIPPAPTPGQFNFRVWANYQLFPTGTRFVRDVGLVFTHFVNQSVFGAPRFVAGAAPINLDFTHFVNASVFPTGTQFAVKPADVNLRFSYFMNASVFPTGTRFEEKPADVNLRFNSFSNTNNFPTGTQFVYLSTPPSADEDLSIASSPLADTVI